MNNFNYIVKYTYEFDQESFFAHFDNLKQARAYYNKIKDDPVFWSVELYKRLAYKEML